MTADLEMVGAFEHGVRFDCMIGRVRRRVIVSQEAIAEHSGSRDLTPEEQVAQVNRERAIFVAAAERILRIGSPTSELIFVSSDLFR